MSCFAVSRIELRALRLDNIFQITLMSFIYETPDCMGNGGCDCFV